MTGLFNGVASSARAMAARLNPVRFARREEGTVTAFALMIFVLMVGACGIAIDVMRYETQRAQLQYTLDRAILAAAALTQPYDPEAVVRDYFDISGLEDYRLDVRVEQGLNFRRVHAYAELEVRSMFMQLFGIRMLTSPAIGAAEERINNIEVSMVIDISGSMGSNSRMTNLRPAARDFITEVLTANDNTAGDENLVSISIVPYNGRVNSGDLIDSVFTFDNLHDYSNCARFTPAPTNYSYDPDVDGDWDASLWADSDFLRTAIDPAVPLARLGHFDRNNNWTDQAHTNSHCQTDQYGAILPWQHDETILHTHINSLGTGGWTAIDLGVNWGVGLLDPAAAPAVDGLIAAGHVHEDFDDRPAPYDDDETIKVVVMMTDGANTNQYDLREPYRDGYSPIFYHEDDDRYSIWYEDQNQFWVWSNGVGTRTSSGWWQNQPYGGFGDYGLTWTDWYSNGGVDAYTFDASEDGYLLSWVDLFADYTAEYIAEQWYVVPANQSGLWTAHNDLVDNSHYLYAGQVAGDRNLRAICDAANNAGIVVFAIGFEAPPVVRR